LPADDVSQTFTIRRATQAITVALLGDQIFGNPPIVVAASASSGLSVNLSAAGACSVAGSLVTFAAAGACTVVASQAGNADYEPAADVARAFGVARAGQTITFAPPPGRTFGDPPLAVTATASSGLPVSFRATGTCVLAADALTITGAGSCAV